VAHLVYAKVRRNIPSSRVSTREILRAVLYAELLVTDGRQPAQAFESGFTAGPSIRVEWPFGPVKSSTWVSVVHVFEVDPFEIDVTYL
jgi:hypothetical protein